MNRWKCIIAMAAATLALAPAARAIVGASVSAPNPVNPNAGYSVNASGSDDFGELETLTVTRNGQYFMGVSKNPWDYTCYSLSVSGYATAPGSASVTTYMAYADTTRFSASASCLVIVRADQTVYSANATVNYGQPFTPAYYGGAGGGAWQFCIASYSNWPGTYGIGTNGTGTLLAPSNTLSNSWPAPDAGTYTFYLRKLGDAYTNDAPPAGPYTVTVNPTNNAHLVAQSVPASVAVGQTFTVTQVWQNTGSKPWSAAGNYNIGSQNPQDNSTWGASRYTSTGTVTKDNQQSYTFNLTAPTTPGTYNFQSRLVQDGVEWFGEISPNVAISVIQYYSLTTHVVPAGAGSVSGAGTYASGTNASLVASSAPGWQFNGWSGDLTGASNPAGLAMNGNKSVTANFVAPTSFSLSQTSFVYDGSAKTVVIQPSPAGATFTAGGTQAAVNAGVYNATATATGYYTGANYGLNWSIAKAPITPPSSVNASITFGESFSPTYIGGTAGAGTKVYSVASYTHWGAAPWTPEAVGNYTFYVGQLGTANYLGGIVDDRIGDIAVNYTAYTVIVNRADPVITFGGLTKTHGEPPFGLSSSSTGGGTPTYAVQSQTPNDGSGTGMVAISGSTVSIAKAGTAVLRVDYPQTTNYNARSATMTLVVNKATGTVALSNLTQTYDETTRRAATATTTPAGLATLFTYTGVFPTAYGPSDMAPAAAGSYTVTAAISDPNYSGSGTDTLVVMPKNINLSFPTTTFVYDGTIKSPAPAPSGATFSWTGNASGVDVGSYTFNATPTGNYTGSTVTCNWFIIKADQIVSISPRGVGVGDGGSATFTAQGGHTSYSWGGTAGATGSGDSKTLDFPLAGHFTVTVQAAASANYNESNIALADVYVESDSDGDGILDSQEIEIGTDPNSPGINQSPAQFNLKINTPR